MTKTTLMLAALVSLTLSAAPGQDAQAAGSRAGQQALAPDVVRDIQRGLNANGYGVGRVDGVFGPRTRAALARFQRDNDLPGRGQVDERSLAALDIIGPTGGAAPRLALAPGQTLSPEMVREVQGELRRLGYDVGRIDGLWGDRTRRALLDFQRERDLAATGRIDTETLAAIQAGGVTETAQEPR